VTFYDESVPRRESERLLGVTLTHLKRLAASGPVIVGARQPRILASPQSWGEGAGADGPGRERAMLLDRLQAAADHSWMLRTPAVEQPIQPRLF
jgi:hypothetical protein